MKRLPHDLKEQGKRAAEAIQLAASAKLSDELGQDVEVAWKPGLVDRDLRRYVRFALELPQKIAEKDDKRIVVLFDEFQQVLELEQTGETKDKKALQKLMRTVFQASNRCSFIFAGSIEHLIRKVFSADEPLGHFGGFYDLSPIGSDDWRKGLAARFALDGCTISDEATKLLLELSESHPRTTMLVAQRAHMAAVAAELFEIDSDLVRLGHAEARVQERARHQTVVDRIRKLGAKQGPVALKTMRRLARGEGIYSGVSDKSTVRRAVERLRDAGFVERTDDDDGWEIRDPLLRLYLADF